MAGGGGGGGGCGGADNIRCMQPHDIYIEQVADVLGFGVESDPRQQYKYETDTFPNVHSSKYNYGVCCSCLWPA